jgi:hypothetical protein
MRLNDVRLEQDRNAVDDRITMAALSAEFMAIPQQR